MKLAGRWQIVQHNPMIILDACHNQEGAETLRQQLQKLPGNKKLTVWFGSLGKKGQKKYYQSLHSLLMKSLFFNPISQEHVHLILFFHLLTTRLMAGLKRGEIPELKITLKISNRTKYS